VQTSVRRTQKRGRCEPVSGAPACCLRLGRESPARANLSSVPRHLRSIRTDLKRRIDHAGGLRSIPAPGTDLRH